MIRALLFTLILTCVPPVALAANPEAEDMENAIESMKDLVPPSELLAKKLPVEVAFGNEDAPVRIVEYASLSCGHCKFFHENVVKKLKESHVETGKVYFVFRHFPLNASALRGAMLVECIDDEARQKLFLDALFKTQEDWAFVQSNEELEEKLVNVGRVGGLTEEKVKACIADEAMETSILGHQLEANKSLKVAATPTLFINGELYTGTRSYDHFVTAIETIIAKQANEKADSED